MPIIPRHPRFWLAAFLLWFASLWLLSSFSSTGDYTPPIAHFDKVAHFGFFFGGSGLFCAWLYRRRPTEPNWKWIFAAAVVAIGVIGCLDEFHQSFTPGRSGNDPFDVAADVVGAASGALMFRLLHRWLK
jgi:VanZ family protein